MQQLHDLIDELVAERDLIDKRIELATALLNTYDPLDGRNDLALEDDKAVTLVRRAITPTPPTPDAPKPAAEVATKPSAKRTDSPKTCPDCGHTSPTGAGLAAHRRGRCPGPTTPAAAELPERPRIGDVRPAVGLASVKPVDRPTVEAVAAMEQARGWA
jgi:hypothetical protein